MSWKLRKTGRRKRKYREKRWKTLEEVEDKLGEFKKTIKDAKEVLYEIILSVVSDESNDDVIRFYKLIFREHG